MKYIDTESFYLLNVNHIRCNLLICVQGVTILYSWIVIIILYKNLADSYFLATEQWLTLSRQINKLQRIWLTFNK